MRNITEEARLVMNTRRNFVNYARITLSDGTQLDLTPSDFRISGNSFTDDWNDSENFQIGSAIGKTATLLLDNTDGRTEEIGSSTVTYPHGKFSQYDFYMSYFSLYVHLPDSTHYQGQLIDEVIPIGTFTVTTPASHGATIEITGVDNMHMFDRPFDDCTLDFNNNGNGVSLLTVLNRCCSDCGVAIGYSQTFTNYNIVVHKKPEGVTYREIVSYIAQIAGCNATISITGALQLKYYDMSPILEILDGGRFNPWDGVDNVRDTLDGGSFNPWTEGDRTDGGGFTDTLAYHNLTATNGTTVSTDEIHFTGVMVSYEVTNAEGNTETQTLHYPNVSDWDSYVMKVEDNPLVESQSIANTVANTIWSAIESLNFRVFSCQSIQDPTIEAGDCALIYDVKGNIYPTIVTNVKFTTGGMTDVSCTAESPISQNSRYVNPAARAEARAVKKQDDYNAMVAHFNELANNSLGYYKTQTTEQGATVTYIHDQSTLASSTIIWKITAAGYFVSEDGGQSWNTGYDASTGTMLMNLIYVNGLHAKWIIAGDISADRLKANVITSINNSTGSTTINGGKIATNSITANHIQANAVTSAKIQANAITADKINSSAVTADKIQANAVTSAKIQSNAVTADKINVTNLKAINVNIGPWQIDDAGFTNGSDSWVKPMAIACGKYGGTLIGMRGADSGDHDGYLEVGVNNNDDYIHVHYDKITRCLGGNKTYAEFNGSDRRIKKNIKKLSYKEAEKLISSVIPRKFEFKWENGYRYGFIAQELREVLDDSCAIEYGEDTRAIHYSDFIAPLCMLVNKQQEEIDELKERVKELESIVNTNK